MQGRIPSGNSLKDKIANFERKGAVPVPRGRFGTSAPPIADGSSRKRGELYGNRVPELAKSTGQAALIVRKRTVSTSDNGSAYTRPTSPVSPSMFALAGDPLPLDILSSHLPPAITPSGRRSVSDVLPRSGAAPDVDTPLPEAEEEISLNLSGTLKHDDPSPPVVIIEEPKSAARDSSDVTTPLPEPLETLTPATPIPDSAEVKLSTLVGQSPVEEMPFEPVALSLPEKTTTPAQSTEELNIETDNASVFGETTASSDSVPTPSDNTTFEMAKVVVKEAPAIRESEFLAPIVEHDAVPMKQEVAVIDIPATPFPSSEPVILSPAPRSSVTSRMSLPRMSTSESVGTLDRSLALDTMDAIIITEPPQIISPRITRGVIVPAPSPIPSPVSATIPTPTVETPPAVKPATPAPPPSRSRPAPSSLPIPSIALPQPSTPPPDTPTEHQRTAGQASFHVVVHGKIRENSTETTQEAPKRVPDFPPPRAPGVQRVYAQAPVIPDSPGLGDLAALMADAALLEEQLANSRSPKKPTPNPTFNVQPAIPEHPEPKQPALRFPGSPPEPSAEDIGFFAEPTFQPTIHLRSSTDPTGPPPPPKDNRSSRIFSSLRVRKQSMPGSYPRTSICSEVSTDSSSVPPSPPQHSYSQHGHDNSISDNVSIRSSSKSWKSPKKGLGRASSWMFRARAKSNPVIEGT